MQTQALPRIVCDEIEKLIGLSYGVILRIKGRCILLTGIVCAKAKRMVALELEKLESKIHHSLPNLSGLYLVIIAISGAKSFNPKI